MNIIEMKLFEAAKETDNKLRWDFEVQNTKFSIYIPKWRVPRPWPSKIYLRVDPRRGDSIDNPNLSLEDVKKDAALTHEPIVAIVSFLERKTETIRYRPEGDDKKWEIGEPYIPKPLAFNESKKLRLIIFWDLLSRGSF